MCLQSLRRYVEVARDPCLVKDAAHGGCRRVFQTWVFEYDPVHVQYMNRHRKVEMYPNPHLKR